MKVPEKNSRTEISQVKKERKNPELLLLFSRKFKKEL